MTTKSEDPKDLELQHFGIKGMKWGTRRTPEQLASGYSKNQHQYDVDRYGKKTAKRINNRVAKGESVKDARTKQVRRENNVKTAVSLGVTTVAIFGPQIMLAAAKGVDKTIPYADAGLRRAERAFEREGMRRGMKAANNLLSDTRGLTSYQTISLNLGKDGV